MKSRLTTLALALLVAALTLSAAPAPTTVKADGCCIGSSCPIDSCSMGCCDGK